MEYRVNKYINVKRLPNGKSLVMNKQNGQSFELGEKETKVIALTDGRRTPLEISEACGFFTEEEIIDLEAQLAELNIIVKSKTAVKINPLKIKLALFSPDKIFGNGRGTRILYYLFIVINSLLALAGTAATIINITGGIDTEKTAFIQSYASLGQFKYYDIVFALVFFIIALILHEFGHMIVARKHDINVPDMGVMLYLLIPCAYTNLTFLNYCKDKSTRLKIFLAGTLSDCGLLGLSVTLFHLFAPHTIAKYFLISALLCMTSVIGNLVITFRFDGYYILRTLLGIDDLKGYSLNTILTNIGVMIAKFKNRDKKLDLRGKKGTAPDTELLFSVIYVFLSIVYIPIMIGSSILPAAVQFIGGLL